MTGVTTAVDLANAIVDRYGGSGFVTNMKLNKLVYFAYAFARAPWPAGGSAR